MRAAVAIVGYGRTPYSRVKPGEPVLTVDEYLAWAADLALEKTGMSKNDFDGQGLGVAHAEASYAVNWSAAVAEESGAQPQDLAARRPGRRIGMRVEAHFVDISEEAAIPKFRPAQGKPSRR